MEHFEKLKANLPDIAKIVAGFPEPLQENVYNTLVSALLGKNVEISQSDKTDKSETTSDHADKKMSSIATITSDGKYHLTVRDLKASNSNDAMKRLVYVIIQSYIKLMKTKSVSRKEIINPEIIKWRLQNENKRGYIVSDKGILKDGDQLCLDQHAQNEADQFIQEIENPEISGTWKPESVKRTKRTKNESDNNPTNDEVVLEKNNKETSELKESSNTQKIPSGEIKTTSTIAQILGVKIEPDLILAAAMKFYLIDNKETFNRAEILTEMKTATSYYKAAFLNNATKYLKKLVREGKLNQNGPDLYAVRTATLRELRGKIGI
jgi:hypothetical protein